MRGSHWSAASSPSRYSRWAGPANRTRRRQRSPAAARQAHRRSRRPRCCGSRRCECARQWRPRRRARPAFAARAREPAPQARWMARGHRSPEPERRSQARSPWVAGPARLPARIRQRTARLPGGCPMARLPGGCPVARPPARAAAPSPSRLRARLARTGSPRAERGSPPLAPGSRRAASAPPRAAFLHGRAMPPASRPARPAAAAPPSTRCQRARAPARREARDAAASAWRALPRDQPRQPEPIRQLASACATSHRLLPLTGSMRQCESECNHPLLDHKKTCWTHEKAPSPGGRGGSRQKRRGARR